MLPTRHMGTLTWSLVVATLNREDCLLRSLRVNSTQTRPPKQVIVVDSSDNWDKVRGRVLAEVAPGAPGVEWIYLGSDQRSSTRQRNLGLARCTADVVFFLDDDSFMYHDCAEEIMRVYEADVHSEIGGVSAALVGAHEGSPVTAEERRGGVSGRIKRVVESMWDQEKLFIPYDGRFHRRRVDAAVGSLVPVPLFHGCRMTFRAQAARAEGGFEEMLIRTAYGEDGDFSYRVSREHALVVAPNARLYHEQTPVQRPKRTMNTSLILLNAIALYRLNHPGSSASWRVAYRYLAKRALLELARDCAKPARRMPNTRGVLRALKHVPAVLALDGDRLRRSYVDIQRQLFDRG
jgi:GT2 family glycosyltransferase